MVCVCLLWGLLLSGFTFRCGDIAPPNRTDAMAKTSFRVCCCYNGRGLFLRSAEGQAALLFRGAPLYSSMLRLSARGYGGAVDKAVHGLRREGRHLDRCGRRRRGGGAAGRRNALDASRAIRAAGSCAGQIRGNCYGSSGIPTTDPTLCC